MTLTKEALELIGVIAVALLTFHGGRLLAKGQRNAVDVTTLKALSDQVNSLTADLVKVRGDIDRFEDTNRILWQYVYALIEQMKSKKIKPIAPPKELESDPVLMKLFKAKK